MLKSDIPELKITIQEALSGLTVLLDSLTNNQKDDLKIFLRNLIESEYLETASQSEKEKSESCRFMAVKFINCSFPFDDAESRLLNIAVQSNAEKPDTIEEAIRGLHPYWFALTQSSNTKSFKTATEVFGMGSKNEILFPRFADVVKQLNSFKEKHIKIDTGKALKFILQCIVMEAVSGKNTVIVVDQEWETRLDKALELDEKVSDLLTEELHRRTKDKDGDLDMMDFEKMSDSALDVFINLMLDHFIETMNVEIGKYLCRVISLLSTDTIGKLVSRVPSLLELIPKIIPEDGCFYLAKILGVVCAHPLYTDEQLLKTVSLLLERKETLPLGFIISRIAISSKKSIISNELFNNVLTLLKSNF
ncbi:unnamed protein product [Ambrosiozyma monospora]|uniref:Unnamed protein product n=1 Tax=Ambrosiozyma monospora TaxID=43982 RepID=A0ACB5TMU1_AMBMO|nr:unnamed protein product [Ambrosiozyma monospora]